MGKLFSSFLILGFLGFNHTALAAGELPVSTNGGWTSWQNVLNFTPNSINSSYVNLGINQNGTLSAGGSLSNTISGIAFPLPGYLLPTEQCDYRLKFQANIGRFLEYTALQKTHKDQNSLSLVFSESSISSNPVLNIKNIILNFQVYHGEYYSGFQAKSDDLLIAFSNQGVPFGNAWNDARFYLQRRCFIAAPIPPTPVKAELNLSSR